MHLRTHHTRTVTWGFGASFVASASVEYSYTSMSHKYFISFSRAFLTSRGYNGLPLRTSSASHSSGGSSSASTAKISSFGKSTRCWSELLLASLHHFFGIVKNRQNGSFKFHQLSAIRSTHGTTERRLCIVASETRNEPSCVSDNPFHQSSVNGLSALCALLHGRQHCAHLSLQLFLIIFNSSVALMKSSWRTSDDCSCLSFGIDTFCPHDE